MQNSIVVLVDVEAVLAESHLENNFYLIDNTRALGSSGESKASLVSAVVGVHNPDGSPAAEAVLNWIGYSISALPPTLPRSYNLRTVHGKHDKGLIAKLAESNSPKDVAALLAVHNDKHGAFGEQRGEMQYLAVDPRDASGEFVSPDAVEYSAHVNIAIVGVRGEAVDNGVIFPGLYGSPDFYTEGWYWSASVDTNKVGSHEYILDIQIIRPVRENGTVTWVPEIHSLTAHIEVTRTILVNGFSGAAEAGFLPLVSPLAGLSLSAMNGEI
jgi:hypothetical protein